MADETTSDDANTVAGDAAPAALTIGDLTPGERADVERYYSDLAAEIAAMDDVELGLLARRADVDPAKYPDREFLVDAIKTKAALDYVDGKLEFRRMEDDARRKVDDAEAKRKPEAIAIRALNVEFCRDIPEEGRSGSFDPGEDHPRFGGSYGVADGRYRVAGSDWIFDIAGQRLVSAFVAKKENNWGGSKVIAVE